MGASFLDGRVTALVGDLTKQATDAIVNAANSTLLGGGGVDGAIHAAGGPEILTHCREIRATRYPDGLPVGEAVITTGGKLPAKFVIHTVGPQYGLNHGADDELLAAAYTNSLSLAVENELTSIAFPSISTGVYQFPKDRAARVSSAAIKAFLQSDARIGSINLVFFHGSDLDTFLEWNFF
ncbi:MAG TPA: O-acetyl-ADP-ribose deacetylase [Pyrinomonadaceae bacterium]|nr:O-acetyl-ADP-ribose deacetylase [Pyrinomonadaceae bacterium]HMU33932.1 O-acetyl-ADP-ribose deacetylase [Pyrinomonadaceae bacterium]